MADGFSGLDDLIRDLQRLPESMQREAANHITAAANGVEAEVRQTYVKGPTRKINGQTVEGGNLIGGVGQKQIEPLVKQVYSRAKHAHLYEFGTVQRFQNNGKSVGTMPAQPTFIPSAVRHRKRLHEAFERIVKSIKVRNMTGSAT
jgi:HK97 gp10 family phage protein